MSSQVVLVTGLAIGGLGYLALGGYVWRFPHVAGRRGLLTILAAVFVWTAGYALEVSSRTVASAELWNCVKYVGVVATPVGLLAYAIEYSGPRGLTRRAVAALSVVPVLTLLSLLLPPTRDLIHVYGPRLRAQGTADHVIVPGYGPLFWPHAVYNYGIAVGALTLLVRRLWRAGHVYRRQAGAVIAASLVPLLSNAAYNAGLFGPNAIDPLPFGFSLLSVVLVWGFFRMNLLDLRPVVRSVGFEQAPDGLIAVDVHGRVVEANTAAEAMLGRPGHRLVGVNLAELHPALEPALRDAPQSGPSPIDVRLPTGRDAEVTSTTLQVGGRVNGRLVVLSDITERLAVQRRLGDLLTEQTRVAEILQSSLRPVVLPRIDGLEVAARSLPASTGGLVSGDFYDVHRVLGGDWAFVLGDVSGKGVEAAVVTSMARYTARTLSAEGRPPAQVLEQLNRALLLEESDDKFCTLAYVRVDGSDLLAIAGVDGLAGAPRGPVRCSVTLGGHPRPLVRRRDGEVEAVGAPGTALGLLPRVDVAEARVVLESGDVLLLYTDGVTEARRGREQFGEDRLGDVLAATAGGLRGRTGLSAAHLVAEAIADRILAEVTEWARVRDDVAVLVLAVP